MDQPDPARPDFIRHWRDIQTPDDRHYAGSDELLALDAPFSRAFNLTRLGVRHQILPPGRRTSYPHAESDEDEFVYVIDGTPDVWIDGTLHRLAPGDGVGFPPGTGIAHSFLNNSTAPVTLLVVGEAAKPHNKVHYPLNPDVQASRTDGWNDAPRHELGPHDGLPRRRHTG
jgi:uncharacterized cupin superfamily protein